MNRMPGLFLCVCLILCGACRDEGEKDLTGHFAVKGNAPLTQLVFVSDDGRIYQLDTRTPGLNNLPQGKRVRVHGRVVKVEMKTADGRITTTRWILKDAKVEQLP